jgi:hypothetical protein
MVRDGRRVEKKRVEFGTSIAKLCSDKFWTIQSYKIII